MMMPQSRLALAVLALAASASVTLTTPSAFAQTATIEVPTWIKNASLGGDLRLRLQHTNIGVDDEAGVLRARLAANFNVNDKLTSNFRFTSGSAANTVSSSFQTMGDGFQKKAFWIDLASFDYKAMDGLVLTAGKAVNPFFSGGKNELLFDADVNPEGVNAKYSIELGDLKPFATVAYNIVQDAASGASDVTLFAGQVGVSYKGAGFGTVLAVGKFDFNGVQGRTLFGNQTTASTATATNHRGNTISGTLNNATYANNYKLTNVEAEVTSEALGVPVAIFGSYINNSEVSEGNQGLLGGLRLGKIKDAGSWMVDYIYRDLGADAIIGTFEDFDFAGQTDSFGHRITASYVVSPGVTLTAMGIFAQRDTSSHQPTDTSTHTLYERYNLEVMATF